MQTPLRPRDRLLGKTLSGGWRVVAELTPCDEATGGYFSTSYIVQNADRQEAFLKAIDFTEALKSDDPAAHMQRLIDEFQFERSLLGKCEQRRLSRIVRVIEAGTFSDETDNVFNVVQYIIFERAEGDIRHHLDGGMTVQAAWALRTAHNVAAALVQLHGVQVAHQDLKPSNVLLFNNAPTKIGDLGRAWDRTANAPHYVYPIAGDRTYAPPELLYGEIHTDYRTRRYGCDAYHLGSLVVFFCTYLPMTQILIASLPQQFYPSEWHRGYREVLPYIQHTFSEVMMEIENDLTFPKSSELAQIIRELCNPDPLKRGHPKDHHGAGNPYSLRRYVSILDRLARTVELSAAGRLPLAGK